MKPGMEIDLTDIWEPKYRQYRWQFDVVGVPSFAMTRIRFGSVDRVLKTSILIGEYVMDDPGVACPIQSDGTFTLRLLDGNGEIVKLGEGVYTDVAFTPLRDLDYTKGEPCVSEFVLHGVRIVWTDAV